MEAQTSKIAGFGSNAVFDGACWFDVEVKSKRHR
jgi:hypothetical protein